MKRENTKALREGAMMAALTAVLVLVTDYMPLFSVIGTFVCGVPMACLSARNNLKTTLTAAFAAYAVSALAVGSFLSPLSIVFISVVPGTVAGYCLGRGRQFFTSLFAVCLAVCIGWIFELVLIDALIGGEGVEGMLSEMIEQLKKTVETVAAALPAESLGDLSPDELVKTFTDLFEYTFKLYFPSIVIVSSMIIGYIIMRFSGFVIKRARLCSIETVPFSRLKAPKSMSLAAVVLYLAFMFMKEGGMAFSVTANVIFVLYTIIGFCGLSFVDSKLTARVKAPAVRALIYAAIFFVASAFLSLIMIALVIIGIMDSTHDYRKIGDARDMN